MLKPEGFERLTVDSVKALMKEFDVTLIRLDYGFTVHNPRSGCAVAFLGLREIRSLTDTYQQIVKPLLIDIAFWRNRFTRWATILNIPEDYIFGLESGFDFELRRDECLSVLAQLGFEDGQALRSFYHELSQNHG